MSELTQCICGYQAAGYSDLIAHQLHCDAAKADIQRWIETDDSGYSHEQAARIAELEAEVTAAHGELAAIEVERRGWQRSQETMRRLLALVEEWERADCRSSTYDCAEQVRAILRGEGPQGWERREGGDNA